MIVVSSGEDAGMVLKSTVRIQSLWRMRAVLKKRAQDAQFAVLAKHHPAVKRVGKVPVLVPAKILQRIRGQAESGPIFKDLLFGLVFCVVTFLAISSMRRTSISYHAEAGLVQSFLGVEYQPDRNFYSIVTFEDFWNWFLALGDNVFPATDENGSPLLSTGRVNSFQETIGGIAVVVRKLRTQSCVSRFAAVEGSPCLSDEIMTDRFYSSTLRNTSIPYNRLWKGYFMAYLAGPTVLPGLGHRVLKHIKALRLLDLSTSSIEVSTVAFNGNTGLWTKITMALLFDKGGGVRHQITADTVNVEEGDLTTAHSVRLFAGALVLMVFVGAWMFVWLRNVNAAATKARQLFVAAVATNGWLVLDLLCMIFLVVGGIMYGMFLKTSSSFALPSNTTFLTVEGQEQAAQTFEVLQSLMDYQHWFVTVHVFAVLLVFGQLMRFCARQPRLVVFLRSAQMAASDVFNWSFTLLLVYVAAACTMMLVYGSHLLEFSTFSRAMESLVWQSLATSKLDRLLEVYNGRMPLLMIAFMLISLLWFSSMFLAIIAHWFILVCQGPRVGRSMVSELFNFLIFLLNSFHAMFVRYVLRRKLLTDQEVLAALESLPANREQISFEELCKKTGYSIETAAKYNAFSNEGETSVEDTEAVKQVLALSRVSEQKAVQEAKSDGAVKRNPFRQAYDKIMARATAKDKVYELSSLVKKLLATQARIDGKMTEINAAMRRLRVRHDKPVDDERANKMLKSVAMAFDPNLGSGEVERPVSEGVAMAAALLRRMRRDEAYHSNKEKAERDRASSGLMSRVFARAPSSARSSIRETSRKRSSSGAGSARRSAWASDPDSQRGDSGRGSAGESARGVGGGGGSDVHAGARGSEKASARTSVGGGERVSARASVGGGERVSARGSVGGVDRVSSARASGGRFKFSITSEDSEEVPVSVVDDGGSNLLRKRGIVRNFPSLGVDTGN